MDNLEFEIEVTSVAEAEERIAEIRKTFGDDVYVMAKIIGDGKQKAFATLDKGMKDLFNQVKEKIANHKGEK